VTECIPIIYTRNIAGNVLKTVFVEYDEGRTAGEKTSLNHIYIYIHAQIEFWKRNSGVCVRMYIIQFGGPSMIGCP